MSSHAFFYNQCLVSIFRYLRSVRHLAYYPLKSDTEIYRAARIAAVEADQEAYRRAR